MRPVLPALNLQLSAGNAYLRTWPSTIALQVMNEQPICVEEGLYRRPLSQISRPKRHHHTSPSRSLDLIHIHSSPPREPSAPAPRLRLPQKWMMILLPLLLPRGEVKVPRYPRMSCLTRNRRRSRATRVTSQPQPKLKRSNAVCCAYFRSFLYLYFLGGGLTVLCGFALLCSVAPGNILVCIFTSFWCTFFMPCFQKHKHHCSEWYVSIYGFG